MIEYCVITIMISGRVPSRSFWGKGWVLPADSRPQYSMFPPILHTASNYQASFTLRAIHPNFKSTYSPDLFLAL